MAGSKKTDIEKLGFEDAIKELTGIVGEIEQGDVALQESLEKYERGMGLIRRCRKILQQAEERIEKISAEEQAEEAEDQQEAGNDQADTDEDDDKADEDEGFASLYD